MSKKTRDLAVRATVAESKARELEAQNRELEVKLATVQAAPPPAPAAAPPPAPPPPAPPATPALDVLAALQKGGATELVVAGHLARNLDAIRTEHAARLAHLDATSAAPAAPPAAPPPVAPPVAPPPPAKTWRQTIAERKQVDPYGAAEMMLNHAHHLDAAAPA